MDWWKVWVVARHEYLTNVRRAGFIIMTAIIPALGIIGLLLGALFAGQASRLGDFFEEQFDVGSKRTGVVDASGYFSPSCRSTRGTLSCTRTRRRRRRP